mgnify:CR=1 FL=1
MDWFVKHWDELTRDELYDLLAVRTAVFVVEQRCPYQEVDGLDRRAWHVFARDGGGRIRACLRVLEPEEGTAWMGRVLTLDRGSGLGLELVRRGLQAAWEQCGARRVRIEAQTYAQGFYEKLGFRRTEAPEFLEDGIPHMEMVLERKQ